MKKKKEDWDNGMTIAKMDGNEKLEANLKNIIHIG